jgi:hypothetical protein
VVHHAGSKVPHHDIRLGHKFKNNVPTTFALEIKGNTLLVGIEKEEETTPFPTWAIGKKWRERPRGVPCAWAFDFCDLRTVISQEFGTVRTGNIMRKIDDTNSTERMLHSAASPCLCVKRRRVSATDQPLSS